MIRLVLTAFFLLNMASSTAFGMLAGGRPNSISSGQNAFAGVVNPANAVWIENRADFGFFLIRQRSYLDNKDNNPFFPPGKINLTHNARYLFTSDAALHGRFKIKDHDCSISLASYTTPGHTKLHTKEPIPIIGTTPLVLINQTEVLSTIFSFKLNERHSFGFSVDYFYLSHRRDGFQRADNCLRSVSPGHVTNNGIDHSSGLGFSFGWRWNINQALTFGFSYVKKSYVGQFRRYRGYEPWHAKNYIPQTVGGGFNYLFTKSLAGRLEVIWTNSGNLPGSNNNILPNGDLNVSKRGSNESAGPGLQDATFINTGMGYKVNDVLSLGLSLSHRIKLARKSPYIISHNYMRQAIYNTLSFGMSFNFGKYNVFLTVAHGFENRQSGYMPPRIQGGKFESKKSFTSFSFAWGEVF